jgi:hypothetical protein
MSGAIFARVGVFNRLSAHAPQRLGLGDPHVRARRSSKEALGVPACLTRKA